MRRRIAIVCACLLACSSSERTRDARETYDYVVTPSGQRYRVIGAGPIRRGANTHMGLRITYVATAKTKAELLADADALAASLGPELQLAGEASLVVRARVGGVSLALDSDKVSYDLDYRLVDGHFQRSDSGGRTPNLSRPPVPDDPTFPFRPELLTAAAAVSGKWLPLLDRDDLGAIRAGVSPAFAKALADDAQFRELLAQRKQARLPGTRHELYRMQERVSDKPRPAGADALIVYECETAGGTRILERLSLARDADTWKIASYAFQPIPP
jgi:hypothetical protein